MVLLELLQGVIGDKAVFADYRRDAPKGKALSRAFQSALSCEQAAHNAAFCTTGI
jgi:hypothetical protein